MIAADATFEVNAEVLPRIIAVALALLAALCLIPSSAAAQSVARYSNTTDSAVNGINETTTPCASRFTRTFTVSGTGYVSDVDIGVLIAHTYRSDLAMYLVSPTGTRVQIDSGVGSNATNFNALMDDEAAAMLSNYGANSTATATTAVPPYSASYRPSNVLSAFDGQNPAGVWTLEICDQANQDSGTFYQADLYITTMPSYADLSLAMSVSSASPSNGADITYTVTVSNASGSPTTATGVTVRDLLPSGVTFVSYSGTGTYNNSTGVWTVGSLAPGQSVSLTIIATVTASSGTIVSSSAEITASSVADADSTPNNAVSGEDDTAAASFTVSTARSAGTAPTLSCPAGTTLFDWDTHAWTSGNTSGTYAVSPVGSLAISITNPGAFLNNATYGGQSPARSNSFSGGLATAENSLIELVDLVDTSQVVTTTVTLANAVPGAQFRIFDVDYGAGQFADKVTVTGYRNGIAVIPTLTNGTANYVVGNSAFGDVASANNSAAGNVVVTFSSSIDQIVIAYGNHSLAPAAPGQQAIGIHDVTFCSPGAAISATKLSSVISDPVNGTSFPKAIPGAVMEYCVLVSNAGPAGATNLVATDALPATFTYSAGSMTSGSNCASATTAEDDDTSGTDESDPYGASLSATTINITAAALANGSSFAVKFRGTIQ